MYDRFNQCTLPCTLACTVQCTLNWEDIQTVCHFLTTLFRKYSQEVLLRPSPGTLCTQPHPSIEIAQPITELIDINLFNFPTLRRFSSRKICITIAGANQKLRKPINDMHDCTFWIARSESGIQSVYLLYACLCGWAQLHVWQNLCEQSGVHLVSCTFSRCSMRLGRCVKAFAAETEHKCLSRFVYDLCVCVRNV